MKRMGRPRQAKCRHGHALTPRNVSRTFRVKNGKLYQRRDCIPCKQLRNEIVHAKEKLARLDREEQRKIDALRRRVYPVDPLAMLRQVNA